jgi:hypothetical protein
LLSLLLLSLWLLSKHIGVVVAIVAVVFVGVFVDSNRAEDVVSYGIGAGALVVGLAVFAWASRKDSKALSGSPRSPK